MTEDTSLKQNSRVRFNGIAPEDYRIFCRQFVTITRAGVSTINALQMIGEQTENRTFRKHITALAQEMGNGLTLSEAMHKHEAAFSPMFLALVKAGEAEGNLEQAFGKLEVCYGKEEKLRETYRKTIVYPLVAALVATGMILAIVLLIVPGFINMFTDMKIELSAFTRGVLSISEFLIADWWMILLVLAGCYVLAGIYAYTKPGKYLFAAMKIKNPILGKLRIKANSASFARKLSTLLYAHVPLEQALDVTADMMKKNIRFEQAVRDAKAEAEKGAALSKPLQACGLFPTLVVHMVSIGEETGELAKALENVAEYYEEETNNHAERLAAVLEPLLILVIALVVGLLIMAMIQPMLALYDAVRMM